MVDRRELLRVIGATSVAGAASIAGCLGGGDGGDGSGDGGDGGDGSGDGGTGGAIGQLGLDRARLPAAEWAHADVQPAEDGENLLLLTIDVETVAQLEDDENQETRELGGIGGVAFTDLIVGLLAAGFGTAGLGLGSVTGQGEDGGSGPTSRLHVVGSGIVFEGEYDPDSLGSAVTEAGLEASGETGGYSLYVQSSGQSEQVSAVGVSESAVVVGRGDSADAATAAVEAMAGAKAGDRERLAAAETTVDQLASVNDLRTATAVEHAPDGALFEANSSEEGDGGGGGFNLTVVSDLELEGDAVGMARSTEITNESLSVRAAIKYASADQVDDRSRIETAMRKESGPITVDSFAVETAGQWALVEAAFSLGSS